MYLLPSSSHPAHVSNNIPYSLAYRIVRICSKLELRVAQFLKLRDFLLSRDYNSSTVDSAIVRAKAIPREVALKKVEKSYCSGINSVPLFWYKWCPTVLVKLLSHCSGINGVPLFWYKWCPTVLVKLLSHCSGINGVPLFWYKWCPTILG